MLRYLILVNLAVLTCLSFSCKTPDWREEWDKSGFWIKDWTRLLNETRILEPGPPHFSAGENYYPIIRGWKLAVNDLSKILTDKTLKEDIDIRVSTQIFPPPYHFGYGLVTSDKGWEILWSGRKKEDEPLPNIDFSKYVLAFICARFYYAYPDDMQTAIWGIRKEKDKLVIEGWVRVLRFNTGQYEYTNPSGIGFCLVQIEKTTLPLEFEVDVHHEDGGPKLSKVVENFSK
jgi:hypothetical protein